MKCQHWRTGYYHFLFADDIVVNSDKEGNADVLVTHLDTTITRYQMDIGPDMTSVDKQPKWLPKR